MQHERVLPQRVAHDVLGPRGGSRRSDHEPAPASTGRGSIGRRGPLRSTCWRAAAGRAGAAHGDVQLPEAASAVQQVVEDRAATVVDGRGGCAAARRRCFRTSQPLLDHQSAGIAASFVRRRPQRRPDNCHLTACAVSPSARGRLRTSAGSTNVVAPVPSKSRDPRETDTRILRTSKRSSPAAMRAEAPSSCARPSMEQRRPTGVCEADLAVVQAHRLVAQLLPPPRPHGPTGSPTA